MRFFSDNTATVSPEILAAITEANREHIESYGNDQWTRRLDDVLSTFFGTAVKAFAVATGSAANTLGISTLCPPYGEVFCHESSHIYTDECGALGFFTGGAQMTLVRGEHGKLTPETLGAAADAYPTTVHSLQPAMLSLTQATELGTVYRPEEVAALTAIAKRKGLRVQMDGARFANALAFLGCHPGDITWRAGVDVLSFGATKNGGLGAEAVVFFGKSLVGDFELRRKRAGHLLSKSRFVSAQILAYVESGLWRRNAEHANRLAQQIACAAGAALLHPVQSNEVFLQLGDNRKHALRTAGFEFFDWGAETSGQARFVVSWDQVESDVTALCRALQNGS